MVTYDTSKNDISVIIGKSYRQTQKILHGELSKMTGKPYVFDIAEAAAIVKYFREKGAKGLTANELFFDPMLSNESKPA
jgi:hypothetical protein